MQSIEVGPQGLAVDRRHGSSSTSGWRSGARRSGRRPLGRPSFVASATPAKPATAKPSDTGLKAFVRIDRSALAAPIARVGIAASAITNGYRLFDCPTVTTAKTASAARRRARLGLPDDATSRSRPRSRPRHRRVPDLWHQALVGEDTSEPADGDRMRDCLIRSALRGSALFEPQTQAVEAPRGGPAEDRPERPPVDELAHAAPAGPVVVARQEAHAVIRGDVAPVASACVDDRPAVSGPELQSRPSGSVWPVSVAQRFRCRQP